jgi:hypothetical protein
MNNQLTPDPDVIEQRMDDQMVLLNLRTNQLYQLNHTAARLWELIRAGQNESQIQEQLSNEFDVEPDQLEAEVRSMIESFQAQKLVIVHD